MPSKRGLGRYIKKKAKAPLETYVPAVLQARGQMLKAGEVMGAGTGVWNPVSKSGMRHYTLGVSLQSHVLF